VRLGLGVPALLLSGRLAAGATAAGPASPDWPRLWGPAGDGAASAPLALAESPRATELWRRAIGSGFSGIATWDERGFTAESDGSDDHAVAFALATGKELWRARLGPTYRGHDGSKDGPISTPAVDGERVYVVGPHGGLLALDAATGRALWQHDLPAEYGAPAPVYGFGTSPLVVGSRVIVQVGGPSHNLAAFEGATGALAWAVNHSKATGYASPVLATLGGRQQVVVYANDLLFAVEPERGSLLWSHPTEAQQESDRSPLVLPGDRVLLQRWDESRLIQVRAQDGALRANELWRSPRLRGSFSPTLFHDGHLFGFSGAYLLCVDAADGRVVWREKVYSGGAILVDGHLLILGDQSGDLRVAQASPQAYRERLKVPVFNAGATSATTPSFARGRILLRNLEEIVALELR
jgi:outer membrane protein assembly factor BamB